MGGTGFLLCRTTLFARGRHSRLVLAPKQLLYTYVNTNSQRNLNKSNSDKRIGNIEIIKYIKMRVTLMTEFGAEYISENCVIFQ